MDAAAELGGNPVSKHQIQPEYGDEQADAGRHCRTRLARPNSQARANADREIFIFSVQLTTCRIDPSSCFMCGHTYIIYMYYECSSTYMYILCTMISAALLSCFVSWTNECPRIKEKCHEGKTWKYIKSRP